MSRFKRRLELGLRWLKCGWRLFGRNPWLLGGMGFSCALLISVLSLIPLVGGLLIALFAPIWLASAYLVIDTESKRKLALPAALRMPAILRSPRELVSVFRHEEHLMQALVASVYSLAMVLLISLLVRLVAGSAWVGRWMSLDTMTFLGVLAMALLALALYFVLAMSLIYALPLAFLQDEALIPAVGRSFKSCAHYWLAIGLILAFLLVPFLIGNLASYLSIWITYLVWIVVGTLVLPIVATSLYCSYRTIFPDNKTPTEG